MVKRVKQDKIDTLKAIILENLEDIGIRTELLDITVEDGQSIVVRGNIETEKDSETIIQTITEITGIEDIQDYMEVGDGFKFDPYSDSIDDYDDEQMVDEDNESYGTEDIFRSVEDGLPYVPPTISPSDHGARRYRRKIS